MASYKLEDCLTLIDAAKALPGRPHVSSLRRWGKNGVRGVKLRTFRSGNRVCTTRQFLNEFLTKCSATSPGSEPSDSHSAAEAKLDALGVTV